MSPQTHPVAVFSRENPRGDQRNTRIRPSAQFLLFFSLFRLHERKRGRIPAAIHTESNPRTRECVYATLRDWIHSLLTCPWRLSSAIPLHSSSMRATDHLRAALCQLLCAFEVERPENSWKFWWNRRKIDFRFHSSWTRRIASSY